MSVSQFKVTHEVCGIKVAVPLVPELDPGFLPIGAFGKAYRKAVAASKRPLSVKLAVVRDGQQVSMFETAIFGDASENQQANFLYLERLVKTLLWLKGGYRVILWTPDPSGAGQVAALTQALASHYSAGGERAFDARFMERVYNRPLAIETCRASEAPVAFEQSRAIGRNLRGCRIGLDLGGSDRKVSAVIDGKVVFSEEVIWHPKTQSDPGYHYGEIVSALRQAATYLPRVDAIGVSSAGIYVDNMTRVASLFLNVPDDAFERHVCDIFLRAAAELGAAPIQVTNDGDVTALAGALSLQADQLLGIAMGTSQAAGFVDSRGNITGWLNELAFVPVDLQSGAPYDEWSGDQGCGVKYFSQDAVVRLARLAGLELSEPTPAESLAVVQRLQAEGDGRAAAVFRSIGRYMGHALSYYFDFYAMRHVLVLGRVTSGEGGALILREARAVLEADNPDLAHAVTLHLPDEKSRRVGQAIAAASL